MDDLNILIDRIKNKEKTLLIFDYDGTLVPIRDKPDLAVMSPMLSSALENIANSEFLKIGIVTGRSINDFKKVSGLDTSKMQVFGMHGGEIEIDGQAINHIYNPRTMSLLETFFVGLKEKCKEMEGILIENKKYSVALHYRLADEVTADKAIEFFNDLMMDCKDIDLFKIQTGKKVIELLPVEFSKDKAISKIIQSAQGYLPFYFGDDVTDISGFEEVKRNGGYAVGIKPLPFDGDFLVDFEVTQSELENFLINLSGAYTCWKPIK